MDSVPLINIHTPFEKQDEEEKVFKTNHIS